MWSATKYVSEEKPYGPDNHYRDSGFDDPVEQNPLVYNKNTTIVKGKAELDDAKF